MRRVASNDSHISFCQVFVKSFLMYNEFMNDELLNQVNIQHIAEEGSKIYETLKNNYDPKEKGKFLAIDIESGKAYLGVTSAEALEKARQSHPNKIFYVVKIGFDFAESMAEYFTSENKF